MAKLSWNKFTSVHPKSYSFTCSVASALPKTKKFDNKGMKLPSPYALFCEWLNTNLVGDWTSAKLTGGFMVKVSDPNDLNTVFKHYSGKKLPTADGCIASYQAGYSNSDYGRLAKLMGYSL
jgi:hypothetical protein